MKLSRLFRSPMAVAAAAILVSGSVFAFAAQITYNNGEVADPYAGQMKVAPSEYDIKNLQYASYLPNGATETEGQITFELYKDKQGQLPALGAKDTQTGDTLVQAKFIPNETQYWACDYIGSTQAEATSAQKALWQCDAKRYNAVDPEGTLIDLDQMKEINIVAVSANGANPTFVKPPVQPAQ